MARGFTQLSVTRFRGVRIRIWYSKELKRWHAINDLVTTTYGDYKAIYDPYDLEDVLSAQTVMIAHYQFTH